MSKFENTTRNHHETKDSTRDAVEPTFNPVAKRTFTSLTAAAIMAIGFASSGNATMIAIQPAAAVDAANELPIVDVLAGARGGPAGPNGGGNSGAAAPGGPGPDGPDGPGDGGPGHDDPQGPGGTRPIGAPILVDPFSARVERCDWQKRRFGDKGDYEYRVAKVCI